MIEILLPVAVLTWLVYGLRQDARAGRLAPDALRAEVAVTGDAAVLVLVAGLIIFVLATGIVGLIAFFGLAAVWRIIVSFMR